MYSKIYDFKNLYDAYKRASKSKRYKSEVLDFSYNLEENIIHLQNELIWKTYKVGQYNKFTIHDPKKRQVVALPFRDRVVQNALNAVIEPIFDKRMISDSYACRVGKGTHATARRTSYFIGKTSNKYYLKADVKAYFSSININILKPLIYRYVKDRDVLWLINEILLSSPSNGIPIGNLMSQLFANVYLHELDHYVKNNLGVKCYLRYMDDFLIFHNDKKFLKTLLVDIETFLYSNLALILNNKTRIDLCKNGVEFVGYRVWPDNKLIKKQSLSRMRRKERAWEKGKMTDEKFLASVGSWLGHSRDTASHGAIERLLLKSLQHSMTK